MKGSILLWLVFLAINLSGQIKKADSTRTDVGTHGTLINDVSTEPYQNLDTIKAPAKYDNIYNRPLYSDPEASSFVIFVKKEVKEHKHETHAEHVIVLEGEAVMKIDGNSFKIKKGDVIFVPKNTWHYVKVTSKTPLKVLSLQAPNFDGKDRILKEIK